MKRNSYILHYPKTTCDWQKSGRIIEIVADFVLATGPGVFTDKNIPIGHSINEVVHYCIISTILSQANLTLAILFIIDISELLLSVQRTANQVIVIERVIYNITSGRTSYRVSDIIAQVNSRTIGCCKQNYYAQYNLW